MLRALLFVVLGSTYMMAQTAPCPAEFPLLVTDPQGVPITDLTSDGVAVNVAGRPVKVNALRRISLPDVYVLLDLSGSMMDKRERMTAALQGIAAALPEDLSVRVGGFADSFQPLLNTDKGKTTTLSKLVELMPSAEFKGPTALYESIQRAAAAFPSASRANILILITDGEESTGPDLGRTITALLRKNVRLFTITLASSTLTGPYSSYIGPRDPSALRSLTLVQQLTREVGGSMLIAWNKRQQSYDDLRKQAALFGMQMQEGYTVTVSADSAGAKLRVGIVDGQGRRLKGAIVHHPPKIPTCLDRH